MDKLKKIEQCRQKQRVMHLDRDENTSYISTVANVTKLFFAFKFKDQYYMRFSKTISNPLIWVIIPFRTVPSHLFEAISLMPAVSNLTNLK